MRQFDFAAGEVLLINKPLRWTSFDAVNKIRWLIKQKTGVRMKVGHAGTLDPLATGLLIICTGKQTKNINAYMDREKEYTGTFVIGATTPCFDLEKEIDTWFPTEHITHEQALAAIPAFIGDIDQVPPVFSAIRVDGKRAYHHARKGTETEMPPRRVNIREFELTSWTPGVTETEEPHAVIKAEFRVSCSKGTYIRSLARDFGTALNSGAHLGSLCRTRIGEFHLKDAMTIEEFEAEIKQS
ncbi:MAG: tRNA pseudouridine(55) synthase TruB [Bacteroidia bacterium]|nr:tRNA pseudouridine(55) synthase TruB [Bacteroidia bacterium]